LENLGLGIRGIGLINGSLFQQQMVDVSYAAES
jgi:hypothetical protein